MSTNYTLTIADDLMAEIERIAALNKTTVDEFFREAVGLRLTVATHRVKGESFFVGKNRLASNKVNFPYEY